jgi:hypothetical protein
MADHQEVISRETERKSLSFILGGSLVEGIAGAGAVVVSIIALASGGAAVLMSIATILVGAALMFEGFSIASHFTALMQETSNGSLDSVEFGAGMTSQVIGGMGVTTLGILALLGLSPGQLVSVAAIAAGGAVLLGSGTTSRLNTLKIHHSGDSDEAKSLAHAAVSSASGSEFLIGIGAIVLGILAVLNISPMILSIIAILAVGFSVLMGGSALSGLAMLSRRSI